MIQHEEKDLAEIDALTKRFFSVFTTKDTGKVDLSDLRRITLPRCLIIKNVETPEVYDLESFIGPREELLNSGRLQGFYEEEVSGRTDLFGNIAQRFLEYRKEGTMEGNHFETYGKKTIQYVRTPEGWRISAVAWDDQK